MAFGALGTPVITLAKVHGYDLMEVTAMIGRQLPFFSVLVPFWLIWAFAGRKGMMEVWPAILVAGVSFAIPQYLVSNCIGPELVDIIAAIVSMACLVGFLRFWQPKEDLDFCLAARQRRERFRSEARTACRQAQPPSADRRLDTLGDPVGVRVPVGMPAVKAWLNGIFAPAFPMEGLHQMVEKMPPVVP